MKVRVLGERHGRPLTSAGSTRLTADAGDASNSEFEVFGGISGLSICDKGYSFYLFCENCCQFRSETFDSTGFLSILSFYFIMIFNKCILCVVIILLKAYGLSFIVELGSNNTFSESCGLCISNLCARPVITDTDTAETNY